MATITPSWTTGNTLRAAAALAGAATASEALNISSAGYDVVNLQVDILIGSSSGVTVKIFTSVDDGTTVDTVAAQAYTVDADDRRTIPVYARSHVTVELTNDDATNATGDITILYDGRKWTSS